MLREIFLLWGLDDFVKSEVMYSDGQSSRLAFGNEPAFESRVGGHCFFMPSFDILRHRIVLFHAILGHRVFRHGPRVISAIASRFPASQNSRPASTREVSRIAPP